MKRTHIHVHLPSRKTKDASLSGKSIPQLLKIWKNPSGDEGDAGQALLELARRGIDPKTGNHVGVKEAKRIVAEIGDGYSG